MRVLARGRQAVVYDLGDGTVLRRYTPGSPSAAAEAELMRYVRERGYPVPAVHEADERDMVMDRVDGPTMARDLVRRPWRTVEHARTLASLQQRLHAIEPPPGLRGRLPGERLVHLDLHPDNVLLGPHGPMVIDWAAAQRGHPAYDPVQTWLLAEASGSPRCRPGAGVIRALRRPFLAAFLGHWDRDELRRHIRVVAERRLGEDHLSAAERERILRFVARCGPGPPSA